MQVPKNNTVRMIGVAVCASVIVVIICMCASGCSTARGVVHGARSIGGGILTDVEAMIDGVSRQDGERPDHWDVPVERAK